MKILTVLPAAIAALVMNTAIAQTPPASAPANNNNPPANQSSATHPNRTGTAAQNFSRADTNRDGKVSRDELTKYGDSSMNFDRLDQDTDGNLSSTEWGRHNNNNDDMDDE